MEREKKRLCNLQPMNENALAQQCPKFHIAGYDLPSGTFASETQLRWWVLCLAETR